MRLRSSQGELVLGRCRAPNLCDYCARLAAVENTEMLSLDALEGGNAPEVWMVLTTRRSTLDMSEFYEAHRQLMRALQRRFPDLQWSRLLEFTTGYGRRSGGKRRPHWNCLLKGVPRDALGVVREVVAKVWCPRVDAAPRGQHVAEISEAGGLMRYIALHFQKESQAPPAGFRGHRFNCSRGFFGDMTVTEARERARASLQRKRALYRAELAGHDPATAEVIADELVAIANATTWELVHLKPPRVAPAGDGQRHIPRPMLEAALRWQDERELIGLGREELRRE